MIRSLLAVVVGVGVAALIGTMIDPGSLYSTLLVIASIAVGPLLAVIVIVTTMRGTSAAVRPRNLSAAQAAGRTTVARVVSIRATGSSVNDQPLCEIELLVRPVRGSSYRTTVRRVVNIAHLPSLQPGAVLVVVQLDADRPEVVVVDSPDPDWARRAATDQDIRYADVPDTWTAPHRGARDAQGILRVPVAVFAALAVAAAAVTLVPSYPVISGLLRGESLSAQKAHAEAVASLHEPGNLSVAIDAVTALSGRDVLSVNVTPDWLGVTAPTAPAALTADDFEFRDGQAERTGATLIQPDEDEVPVALFDVDEVDWDAVPTILAEASRLSGIEGNDPPMVLARRSIFVDEVSAPQFSVSVRDDYYDAWFTFAADGSLVDMRGGAPGSEARAATDAAEAG